MGELLIRGPQVVPGYWNRPAETAQTFVDGWLHTGDLARRDDEGYYYIVGRLKDMIISGGENIYPAEVEGVLASHPGVVAVALIGVPDPHWGEVGRAIVVARPGAGAHRRRPAHLRPRTPGPLQSPQVGHLRRRPAHDRPEQSRQAAP